MRYAFTALLFLIACKDSGCRTSQDAESLIKEKYGVTADCIPDDEDSYACSSRDGKDMYRCSNVGTSSIKCIGWWPSE